MREPRIIRLLLACREHVCEHCDHTIEPGEPLARVATTRRIEQWWCGDCTDTEFRRTEP
jgi:hypothetical protein